VTAEIAKAHAESEFDRLLKQLGHGEEKKEV